MHQKIENILNSLEEYFVVRYIHYSKTIKSSKVMIDSGNDGKFIFDLKNNQVFFNTLSNASIPKFRGICNLNDDSLKIICDMSTLV